MAHRTDLYSILISYADKNNSPYVGINSFLDFLGRYARRVSEEHPEWLKWVHDRSAKFWSEMGELTEEGKCELLTDTEDGRVYMPHFYIELLEKALQSPDDNADIPFPGEEALGITLPESQVRALSSNYDLLVYLSEAEETETPIVKITFPDSLTPALILTRMVPRELTEMAILKVRNYLRKGGNKEYASRKLVPQLQGRESALQGQINQILTRPLDCYTSVEAGNELSYLFWAHFCILVKNDIKRKKELLSDDVATLQSVYIIEAVNGYFKAEAVKRREAELAFRALENHLAKPPYLYTLDQILKLTSPKGVLLLGQYTDEELENWLKKKTTDTENNEMPALLIVRGEEKNERCFVLKEKLLPLCGKLLADARARVKDAVSKHWRKALSEYRSEAAMENDAEFEKLLARFARKLSPLLVSLFEDPKLLLVYEEVDRDQGGVPQGMRIFSRGQLLPYGALFFIRRKEILNESKLYLPFWYSIPVITAVIAFFKNLLGRRKVVKLPPGAETFSEEIAGEEGILREKDRAEDIRAAAEELELAMVPPGFTMESYLEELETRWSRLIDRQARKNLVEDVQSLIRDNLRRNIKIQKHFRPTQEIINQMAENIVTRTPSLASLNGRDSLILYSELYLVKLLENIK